jgi:hypothetical protein
MIRIGYFPAAALLLATTAAYGQTQIIPQIADGGGWQTTLVLTNTTTAAASASLSFYEETSGGATQSWNLAFLESVSPANLTLPGGGTLFLHTPGTDSGTSVGWAQLQAGSGLVAYAIFTQRVPGRQDQDGTAPAATSASRVLVPFDNSPGFATGVALANSGSAAESVSVNIQTDTGVISQASIPSLPALGHMSFSLAQQFPGTAGQRGLAEFYTNGGSLTIIALRFNPTGAFTSAPVYAETGSPIIGASGGGGGTLPSFSQITITGNFSPSGQPSYQVTIQLTSLPNGTVQASAESEGVYVIAPYTVSEFSAVFPSSSLNGLTLTSGGFQPGNGGQMADEKGNMYGVTSASLSLTLSPQSVATTGNVTGTLSLASSLATFSGSITGTYILYPPIN